MQCWQFSQLLAVQEGSFRTLQRQGCVANQFSLCLGVLLPLAFM